MKRVFVPWLRQVTRRCSSQCALVRFASTGPLTPSTSLAEVPAEEDFVDVGFLGGMGSPDLTTQSDPLSTSAEPVLGIVRASVHPAGTEYSRFNVPLETPRGGKPIPRENSRALLSPWEEEALMRASLDGMSDETAVGDAAATTESTRQAMSTALQRDQTMNQPHEGEEKEDGIVATHSDALTRSVAAPLPDPGSLPYDDEKFAETILEMEVDGAIDDAWQDSRKAHLEDVKEVLDILKSLKVRDICCIDVSAKTGNFDYMMFGTCEGARHIHLAAWAAQEADSLRRVSKIKRKQTDELWEVVPIGRIVLNLMVESLRDQLTLERKWAVTTSMDPVAAANAPVSEGRQVRAHGLWTLTLNLQDLEDFEVDYCKDVLLRQ